MAPIVSSLISRTISSRVHNSSKDTFSSFNHSPHPLLLPSSPSDTISAPPPPAIPHSDKRRVRFASNTQTLYFLSSRPASRTAKPIYKFTVSCTNAKLEHAQWLTQVSTLKREPFCQLDYLQASYMDGQYLDDDLFPIDGINAKKPFDFDDYLFGEVAVYNLDYQKKILIHLTFDNWITKSISEARYSSSISTLRIDKFKFQIPLPTACPTRVEEKKSKEIRVQIAVEYRVNGKSYWDSMNGMNYNFNIKRELVEFEDDNDWHSSSFSREKEQSSLQHYHLPPPPLTTTIHIPSRSKSIPIPIPIPKPLMSSCPPASSKGPTRWASSLNHSNISSIIIPPTRAASWDCTKSFTLLAATSSISSSKPFLNILDPFIS